MENVIGEKHKFTKLGTSLDYFLIKFRLDRRIGSKYQVLVYYITSTGETVAATKNIEVEPCLLKVSIVYTDKINKTVLFVDSRIVYKVMN